MFYSVPGGRIDHGHHSGKAVRALNDAVAMAKACGKAMEMTNRGNTLVCLRMIRTSVITSGRNDLSKGDTTDYALISPHFRFRYLGCELTFGVYFLLIFY